MQHVFEAFSKISKVTKCVVYGWRVRKSILVSMEGSVTSVFYMVAWLKCFNFMGCEAHLNTEYIDIQALYMAYIYIYIQIVKLWGP